MSDYIREIAGFQPGSIHDPNYMSPGELRAELLAELHSLTNHPQDENPVFWMTIEEQIEYVKQQLNNLPS